MSSEASRVQRRAFLALAGAAAAAGCGGGSTKSTGTVPNGPAHTFAHSELKSPPASNRRQFCHRSPGNAEAQ